MAFGNYYPNYYNPAPYQPALQSVQQPLQQNNGILWVQGEAGAKAYPVAPGASVLLMDSESKTMYLKGADASGIPSMRIFDYSERVAPIESPAKADYVTREEFTKLVEMVKQMKGENNEQSDL